MNSRRLILILLCLAAVTSVSAQKINLKQANKYYEAGKYQEAAEIYNQAAQKDLNKNALFKRGVANYHINKTDEALSDFRFARQIGFKKKEIYYYAAMALHSKKNFVDAAKFYKNYLRYVDEDDEKFRVIELIKQCKFGFDNQFNDQLAFVENLGESVNTEYDELNPVQSPTSHNKYYFSSNRPGSHGGLRNARGYKDEIYGNYSADMYAVELSNGNWTPVSACHPILNGPKHDLIEGFNPSGSVMYFLKSQDGKTGEIYADTFAVDKDPEAFPQRFSSPVISELGDKGLQVFNNNTILFASKREGGYGGYDLYLALREDGQWLAPVNLGPEINSKYDETCPFLAKSGTKLFFSSNRIESFGGYDVYSSDFGMETRKWGLPVNIGLPINSGKDDQHFSVSSDGMTAIFSSDRPESIGGTDLYIAYFKNQVHEQLLYTEYPPFVVDDRVVDGIGKDKGSRALDSNTSEMDEDIVRKDFVVSPLYYGDDEIILNPANSSKMDQIRDLMTIYPEMNIVLSGHSIKEGMKEFDLYFSIKRAEKAADYLIRHGIEAQRINVKGLGANFPHTGNNENVTSRLALKNNRRIDIFFLSVPYSRLNIIEDRPIAANGTGNEIFEEYEKTISGLAYKIQIARTKQMFKGDVIREYNSGIVEKNMTDDTYTYTLGVYDTYSEVRALKSELQRKGMVEAKVVPYFNNLPLNSSQIDALKDSLTDLNEYLKFESK